MLGLYASFTDNLSLQTVQIQMLVVIKIQTAWHTDGIGWYSYFILLKSRLASVLKKMIHQKKNQSTRGVQYVMKTTQYIPKFYIYTPHNYLYLKICFLAK